MRKFFEGFGIVVFMTVLMFGAAEAVIRIFFAPGALEDVTVQAEKSADELCKGQYEPYDAPGQCYFSQENFAAMDFSVYLGHVPAPDHKGQGYYTNRQRMRYSEDIPAEKPRGEIRIFITGGSTAWGAGVRQDQLYSAVAESALRAQFPESRLRLVSAGVGSYTTLQEILMYELNVKPLAPDVWVMFTGWNDIYTGYRGRAFFNNTDAFGIGDKLSAFSGSDVVFSKRMKTGGASLVPPQYGNYSFKLAYIVDKAIYKIKRRAQKAQQGDAVGGATDPQDVMPIAEVTRRIEENIRTANAIAKLNGVKFVVYLQPSVYSTKKPLSDYEKSLLALAKNYPGLEERFAVGYESLRKDLPALAAKEGFTFIDADEAIAAETRSLFVDHVHFGDRGNRLLGNYLAQELAGIIETTRHQAYLPVRSGASGATTYSPH